jgi:hypothetical protein
LLSCLSIVCIICIGCVGTHTIDWEALQAHPIPEATVVELNGRHFQAKDIHVEGQRIVAIGGQGEPVEFPAADFDHAEVAYHSDAPLIAAGAVGAVLLTGAVIVAAYFALGPLVSFPRD